MIMINGNRESEAKPQATTLHRRMPLKQRFRNRDVCLEERNDLKNVSYHYIKDRNSGEKLIKYVDTKLQDRSNGRLTDWFSVFLPNGYPDTVSDDYLTFQIFDTIQALCSYLRGVLSNQAILTGLGVGQEDASVLAAATQWIYRDGAGMIGGLLFVYFTGKNSSFERNIKGWRFFADFINDAALTIELIAPLYPSYFILLICMASVFKSLCGVAAGGTRTLLTAHFAKCNNMADVASKEGSQETFVTLIGMILGLHLAQITSSLPDIYTWFIFLTLTIIHLIANYIAVASLELDSLNQSRLSLVFNYHQYHQVFLTPKTITKVENFIPWFFSKSKWNIKLGCSLKEFFNGEYNYLELDHLMHYHNKCSYIVKYDIDLKRCFILFHTSCKSSDVYVAWYHAQMALFCMEMAQITDVEELYEFTDYQNLHIGCEDFLNTLDQNGWNISKKVLDDQGWRLNYKLQ